MTEFLGIRTRSFVHETNLSHSGISFCLYRSFLYTFISALNLPFIKIRDIKKAIIEKNRNRLLLIYLKKKLRVKVLFVFFSHSYLLLFWIFIKIDNRVFCSRCRFRFSLRRLCYPAVCLKSCRTMRGTTFNLPHFFFSECSLTRRNSAVFLSASKADVNPRRCNFQRR